MSQGDIIRLNRMYKCQIGGDFKDNGGNVEKFEGENESGGSDNQANKVTDENFEGSIEDEIEEKHTESTKHPKGSQKLSNTNVESDLGDAIEDLSKVTQVLCNTRNALERILKSNEKQEVSLKRKIMLL